MQLTTAKKPGIRLNEPQHILISRTDSIGDVILTLPLAGLLKEHFPDCIVTLAGQNYTRPVAENCSHIDGFLDWKMIENEPKQKQIQVFRELKADIIIHVFPNRRIAALAALAGIPLRIGSTGRLWHWYTCNRLVPLSRRNSPLHESQLNLILLKPTGIKNILPLKDIPRYYGLSVPDIFPRESAGFDPSKKHIILHPGSKGSAREWGLDNFSKLAGLLNPDEYQVFITGTAKEGESMKDSALLKLPNVQNLCGLFSLTELMSFIKACDALVACSTGPLHIAAALGVHAIGIYPPIRPMHPGRWAPLGQKVSVHVIDKQCDKCRKGSHCECIMQISPEDVAKSIFNPVYE